jgi:hypothetical protein
MLLDSGDPRINQNSVFFLASLAPWRFQLAYLG